MNTSYIDMYFIHSVSDVKDELTNEVKAWAEKVKAKGKIRFFGLSSHKNMEVNMLAAAKLGWIDGHENPGGLVGQFLCDHRIEN